MTIKQILSVNVSPPVEVPYQGGILRTGIYKQPVTGRVALGQLGLAGDGQADLQAHGGPDKAVYAYPYEHYQTWAQELGRTDFSFGQFGENLTVTGMLEDRVCIGDVFRIGSALVEVTQPRVPCFKLAHKMNMPEFVRLMMQSERTGFYLRVLEPGEVGADDTLERVRRDPEKLSIREAFHTLYFDKTNRATIERALRVPALAAVWRDSFEALAADLD